MEAAVTPTKTVLLMLCVALALSTGTLFYALCKRRPPKLKRIDE